MRRATCYLIACILLSIPATLVFGDYVYLLNTHCNPFSDCASVTDPCGNPNIVGCSVCDTSQVNQACVPAVYYGCSSVQQLTGPCGNTKQGTCVDGVCTNPVYPQGPKVPCTRYLCTGSSP